MLQPQTQLTISDCPDRNVTDGCRMVMIRFSTAANAKDAYPAKINGTGSFGWVGILFLELI